MIAQSPMAMAMEKDKGLKSSEGGKQAVTQKDATVKPGADKIISPMAIAMAKQKEKELSKGSDDGRKQGGKDAAPPRT